MTNYRPGMLIRAKHDTNIWRLIRRLGDDEIWYAARVWYKGRYVTEVYVEELNVRACVLLDALHVGLMFNELAMVKQELDKWAGDT